MTLNLMDALASSGLNPQIGQEELPGLLYNGGTNTSTNDSSGVLGASTGGGNTSSSFTGPSTQQVESNRQIDYINQLLGLIGSQRNSGISNLNSGAAEEKRRLGEQRQSAMAGYDNQGIQNTQARQRGYDQVDNFANSSANSLQRIFQGANAGNSSVARLLAPHLVGKASDSRRLGVTQTANENQDSINNARSEADNQFNYSEQDIENQRRAQEGEFRRGITQQESDLLAKRLAFQQDAGQATAGTQAEIDSRMAQLNALFGQFKPSYNVRATPTKQVSLNSYNVDPAQLRIGQQGGSSYYAPQLKKKQELA